MVKQVKKENILTYKTGKMGRYWSRQQCWTSENLCWSMTVVNSSNSNSNNMYLKKN